MNIDLIANILVIATVLFIGFWLVMLVGWMRRPGTSARKPLGERNERNERTELNELEGRSGQSELNQLTGRNQRTGLTELNELNRNPREGDEH